MQTRAGTWEAGREPGLEALKEGSRVQGGSEGRATQQTAAWLSPAQHLGAGTSLLSFPGISRKKACPPGGCQGPRATLALGGSGSGRPLGALRLCLCTSSPPGACLAHHPCPSANAGAQHGLPGLGRSCLPTVSTPAARPAWRTSRTGARMPKGRRQRT